MAGHWNRLYIFSNRLAWIRIQIRRHVSVCSNNTNSDVISIACLHTAWYLTPCVITWNDLYNVDVDDIKIAIICDYCLQLFILVAMLCGFRLDLAVTQSFVILRLDFFSKMATSLHDIKVKNFLRYIVYSEYLFQNFDLVLEWRQKNYKYFVNEIVFCRT